MRSLATESVYQQVLLGDWETSHPRLRTYFGPAPSDHVGVGRGTYEFAGSRYRLLRLVFAVTARNQILFPEVGRDVPFTVINDPQPDGSLTATRVFAFPNRTRLMHDTFRYTGTFTHEYVARGEMETM